jgi:uncharacterized protein YacL (UPF0231 family)
MDYQFKTDLYGQPSAKFSMGHEAIARWLSDELSSNQNAVRKLIDLITEIENGEVGFREFNGTEFQLTINLSGIQVNPLEGSFDQDDFLLEDNNIYEGESFAECGLTDFKEVLTAWLEFIEAR